MGTVSITPLETETLHIPIIGTTPLIMNNWSHKARQMMLDTMQGRKAVKQIKDPVADFHAALYRLGEDTYGMPSLAFKSATVAAARYYSKLNMTDLRQIVFFHGEPSPHCNQLLVPIKGTPEMREDAVRTAGRGGADLRYRPEFMPWSAVLQVSYVVSSLSFDSLLSLINGGGMGVGIGDWRPERKGENGTYMIEPDGEIQRITKTEKVA